MNTDSSGDASAENADLGAELAQTRAALQASREREAALLRELEHRVRNTLAVTRSVFSRTMATTTSVEEAHDHFLGRLDALARYRARFAPISGSTFDLETMIWDELIRAASGNDPRIVVAGPAVTINDRAAQVVGLAVHELTTNSVKFGVLSDTSDNGSLQIEWRMDGDEVRLDWREVGVPIVASAPIARGFGREYIEEAMPYQLGASADFSLVPGGLICRMKFCPDWPPTDTARGQVVDLS